MSLIIAIMQYDKLRVCTSWHDVIPELEKVFWRSVYAPPPPLLSCTDNLCRDFEGETHCGPEGFVCCHQSHKTCSSKPGWQQLLLDCGAGAGGLHGAGGSAAAVAGETRHRLGAMTRASSTSANRRVIAKIVGTHSSLARPTTTYIGSSKG